MKHKYFITTIVLAMVWSPVYEPANADGLDNFYTKFEVGMAKPKKLKNKERSSLGGKYNRWNKTPESSITYGVGLGYQFNDSVRADLMITDFKRFKYRAEVDVNPDSEDEDKATMTQDLKSTASILNLHYTINNIHSTIKPFVGVGIGIASNKGGGVKTTFEDEIEYKDWNTGKEKYKDSIKKRFYAAKRKTHFAWNIQAGFSFIFTERINLDIFYRYLDLGKVSTQIGERNIRGRMVTDLNPFKSKLKIHSAGVALRLKY